jgi:hypothetical protein
VPRLPLSAAHRKERSTVDPAGQRYIALVGAGPLGASGNAFPPHQRNMADPRLFGIRHKRCRWSCTEGLAKEAAGRADETWGDVQRHEDGGTTFLAARPRTEPRYRPAKFKQSFGSRPRRPPCEPHGVNRAWRRTGEGDCSTAAPRTSNPEKRTQVHRAVGTTPGTWPAAGAVAPVAGVAGPDTTTVGCPFLLRRKPNRRGPAIFL